MFRSACLIVAAILVASGAASAQWSEHEEATFDGDLLSAPMSPLYQAALQRGEPIPVIVMVNAPRLTSLSAPLDRYDVETRASNVTDAVDRVLQDAFGRASGGLRLEEETAGIDDPRPIAMRRTFRVVPGFAAVADSNGLQALRSHPDVIGIYPDRISVPLLDETPALIGANSLWAIGVEGQGQAIAILDTGVDKDHPMVAPAVTASACFSSNVTDRAETLCPDGSELMIDMSGPGAGDACLDVRVDPDNGSEGCTHGTHVASIAAGRTVRLSSGGELNGVARRADIVAVNVFSRFAPEECDDVETHCVRSYTSDQIAALEWLLEHREDLNLAATNMSLGGDRFYGPCLSDPTRDIIQALRSAGVATFVSSGNDGYGDSISSPACVPEAIAIGATDNEDEAAGFSNSSNDLELLAPGVNVLGALVTEEPEDGENCIINDAEPREDGFCHWLGSKSGTSMASPHAAGAFTILRSAFPSRSVDEIVDALKFTGVQVLDVNGVTRSRVQVDAAYDLLRADGPQAAGVALAPVEAYRASGRAGLPDTFPSRDYTLTNRSGFARSVSVNSAPDWLEVALPSGTLAAGETGTITLSVNPSSPPTWAEAGQLVLQIGGQSLTIPVSAQVERNAATAQFGPFEWTGGASAYTRSVFRVVGLNNGAPQAINVALRNAIAGNYSGDYTDCSLTIRPERYSRGEYIIQSTDLSDCGDFRRADVMFEVTTLEADIINGLRLRRFGVNSNGGITGFGFDDGDDLSEPGGATAQVGLVGRIEQIADLDHSSAYASVMGAPQSAAIPQSTSESVEFGPFEWTGHAGAFTGSVFRLTGLENGMPESIRIAVGSAAAAGYIDDFSDCSLTMRSARFSRGEYIIAQSDLSDCGNFIRGDLRFQVQAHRDDIDQLVMRRFAITADGGLTDFGFDADRTDPTALEPIGNGEGEAVLGPFEWTGDSRASTASVFRIVGFEGGLPNSIDVAISNARVSGYGDLFDCNLTIRAERARFGEYLVFGDDLADCGDFGRADLSFRLRADLSDVPVGLRMRRFGVGGAGDITDFAFDQIAPRNGAEVPGPADAPSGSISVEFGPFEWTGDAGSFTRSVFRLAGLNAGPPDLIDIALANPSEGDFEDGYAACRLQIRPERAGEGEYVIAADDLSDCGDFGRADLLFRVTANAADVANGLTMRRFAITRNGGLTDFGFDP